MSLLARMAAAVDSCIGMMGANCTRGLLMSDHVLLLHGGDAARTDLFNKVLSTWRLHDTRCATLHEAYGCSAPRQPHKLVLLAHREQAYCSLIHI